jgi:hypothetical protein
MRRRVPETLLVNQLRRSLKYREVYLNRHKTAKGIAHGGLCVLRAINYPNEGEK